MAVFFLLGNTNVKFATRTGDVTTFPIDQASRGIPPLVAPRRGDAAVAACVNPLCEPILGGICRMAGLKAPVYVGRSFPAGVEMAVENSSVVGIDRVLNVKAAYSRARAAAAAVDLGTAISVSVCDGEGRFVGGAILPGMRLSLKALSRGTAFLPDVAPARPAVALGTSTIRALHSGIYYGTLGGVREVVRRIGEELGTQLAVFLTGGDCELIAPDVPAGWQVVPALTVEGLALAYEESL